MANENEDQSDPIEGTIEESAEQTVEENPAEVEAEVEEKTELELLQEQLEQAEQKAKENWETALRAQAETDNIRKRATKDVESAHKYSMEKLVKEFLPIKDSLELGLSAADQASVESLVEGMGLTLKTFLTALEKCGVTEINPADEKFDPELHQAMTMIESEEVESGQVIEVMQKGYLLKERLIRPAMVVVAK